MNVHLIISDTVHFSGYSYCIFDNYFRNNNTNPRIVVRGFFL